MSNRSLMVRLQAEVSGFTQKFGQAKKATEEVRQATEATGKAQEKAAQQAEQAAKRVTAAMVFEAQAAQDNAKAKGLAYNAAGQLVDANGRVLSSSQAAAQGLDRFSESAYLVAQAEKAVVSEAEAVARAADEAAAAASRASRPFQQLRTTLEEVSESAKNNRQAWDDAGQTLTAFGAVTVGALGVAAKAAMDWESSWAGVTKTVDGTPEQMAELETGLRNLAKTLPLTHAEIAGVAEAAGQLGVAREDVLGFTKTMIDLGESTNLTAEEAATQIAQISNVMGTMEREGSEGVARLGATLVELGNNGASTEADILAMSQRIAGAMATVGGSEVEALALANALSSMGVKAELGGGVTTRVLLGMYSAIKDGGAELEAFAETAGMSASQFAAAFEASPVTALSMVSQGLGRVKDEGGNVVASLSDMGIKGTESTQVMLALASSGTMLADGLAMGNKAWQENTALVEEASKRYATTESQVKIAWNGITDAAIDAGAVVLPVIRNIAETVADLADWFGDLPAPVQGALSALTGIAGAGALAAGGFLLVVPRVLDTISSFKTLKSDMPGVSDGLSKIGRAAGVAGAIAGVGFAIAKIAEASYMDDIDTGMGKVSLALAKVSNEAPGASTALDELFKDRDGEALTGSVNDLESAIERTFNKSAGEKFNDWAEGIINGITGIDGSSQILEGSWDRIDMGLSDLVNSGNAEGAKQTFQDLQDRMVAQGATTEEVAALFPQYADALASAAAEQESAAGGAEQVASALEIEQAAAEEAAAASEEFAEAMAELGLSTEGVIIDLEAFTDALFGAGLATMSSRDAAFGWEETLRGMGGAIQEVIDSQGELGPLLNGTATDFNEFTDSGKAANETLQGIVSGGLDVASTFANDVSKSAADVNQQLISTYDAGVQAAQGLGLGRDEAINLVRELMQIPPGVSIETWMSDDAAWKADQTGELIRDIPESVFVETAMDSAAFETAGMTKQAADDIPNQETIDSWMSDAAFQEALRTRAAALGIPESEVIASFMESAARNEADNTTAAVLKIPTGASVSAFMDAYIRDMAAQSSANLNALDGRTVNTYANHHETTYRAIVDLSDGSGAQLKGGQRGFLAGGGRIPRLAVGGRLPTTGPGTDVTDGILGISTKDATPVSWLDGGEQITSAAMTEKHSDLLWAIHRDDPRLAGLPAFARGGRTGGLVDGLSTRPGEENWQWQSRQQQIVEQMADVVGGLADWEIHEDGSGWIRTMDNTMIEIADGAWRVSDSAALSARAMERASQDAYWAGQTATAAGGAFQGAGSQAFSAGGSFQAAGVSANATAGTFTVAGQVTQQAAQAIIAATAAVNAAGQQQAPAQGGGIIAQAGESNATWRGRQDQFEQAIAQQFGGIKYSALHEDGSGMIELDDGRKIDVRNGRWEFVREHEYGWGPQGPQLSKYQRGGRLPRTGPGTHKRDGFLAVDALTGAPRAAVDGGEQITSAAMTDKHSDLLWAIHRDDPALSSIALAGGGRAPVREYAPPAAYATAGGAGGGPIVATLDPRTEALLQSVAVALQQPLKATWNGREVLTAVRRAGVEERQGG